MSVDLTSYFDRIGYRGTPSACLRTLTDVLLAHTERIPFENFDVLLGRGIKLDLPSLEDKLVVKRRGGYCFEHVTLFAAVLEEMGFSPIRHTARATLVMPRDQAPRTHMFLTVPLDEGLFVIDPGFGGLAPRFPVPVDTTDPDATHWMERDGIYSVLKIRNDNKIIDAWVSTLEPDNLVDFELGNYYTSTHPNSGFVNRLMLRAFYGTKVVSVMNKSVMIRDGISSETMELGSRSELRSFVEKYFGFDLPEIEDLRVPLIPEWV